ncbi:MAG: type II toxin-antitoxin system VapC family toxin [Chloroflexota bacterium]
MLDTNACIGAIRRTSPVVLDRLREHSPGDVAISQIVQFELEYGACHSQQPQRNRARLEHFLRYIEAVDWGKKQSREAAKIRCELGRSGRPIGPYDVLIAAHARSIEATLVTHNTRELAHVPGLVIEDWELP